jgi:hypothetical protein
MATPLRAKWSKTARRGNKAINLSLVVDRMRALLFVIVLSVTAPAFADSSKTSSEQSGSEKDKMICRREVPIGSLIASRKMCLTKDQWRKRADDGNAMARQLVEDGAGACGHNGGVCPF